MIYSENQSPSLNDFSVLLNSTLIGLEREAKAFPNAYAQLLGNKLEHKVLEIAQQSSVGGPFEGSLELISGQRFPDIIAAKLFGLEVKSTKQDHWKSTGNSVMESTRVEGIERIFMLFGKMADPIEFKCRPYHECLSEVLITHSPRYGIDMRLAKGETIFDKIGLAYDEIRGLEQPFEPFRDLYKKNLKPGQTLWWLEGEEGKQPILRIWNTIGQDEQQLLKTMGFLLFPEILGKSSTKFYNFSLWLTKEHAIVSHSVRDIYTAGGQAAIELDTSVFTKVPKVIFQLIELMPEISSAFEQQSLTTLSEVWGAHQTSWPSAKGHWVKAVDHFARKSFDFGDFRLSDWLLSKL